MQPFRTAALLLCSALASCAESDGASREPQGNAANTHMNESGFRDLVDRFEAPDRNQWQCPDLIMDQLGPLDGLRIMDLGAGTGYFSVRFVDAGAQVIAADVDQRFLDFLANRAKGLGYTEEQMRLRRVPYDDPSLQPAEVDLFFTCNTYHHIENRAEYMSSVRKGLAPGGRVVIVDFTEGTTPHGPPAAVRVSAQTIGQELRDAGFRRVAMDSTLLPEQVLVMAWP
jgi:SAM-dependent methyltransferase